jgi:hypothetical protein
MALHSGTELFALALDESGVQIPVFGGHVYQRMVNAYSSGT